MLLAVAFGCESNDEPAPDVLLLRQESSPSSVMQYTYDGNNIVSTDFFVAGNLYDEREFHYDNGVLVSVSLTSTDGLKTETKIEYSPDGFPLKESFAYDFAGLNWEMVYYEFHFKSTTTYAYYPDNLLKSYSEAREDWTVATRYDFEWNNGNVIKMTQVSVDLMNGQETVNYTEYYTHDEKPNYLNQNMQFKYCNARVASILSRNNIIKVEGDYDGTTATQTFDLRYNRSGYAVENYIKGTPGDYSNRLEYAYY